MKIRTFLTAAVSFVLAFAGCTLAYGADGRWIQSEEGWRYERADGSMAKGTWEDIDGEWYFFGRDGLMQAGWNQIGNILYYLEPDGKLSRGWQCYKEDGGETWYYYDANGNAVIRWFQDNGKWYWFHADGTMNTAPEMTIGGKLYDFHEDGSMKANEYDGFQYINPSGQKDSRYDITAVGQTGSAASADSSVQQEIAGTINAFPAGWRKKFVDDDWKFVYEPEGGADEAAGQGGEAETYDTGYCLKEAERTLSFADTEALKAGFGEYMYRASGKLPRNIQFPEEVQVRFYAIAELTGLPEECRKDYPLVFGAVFAKYQEEETREQMKEKMKTVCWYVEEISGSRKTDGTLIDRLLP